MSVTKLLIANRGEIAIRIMRAAAELNIETLAVYSEDDRDALHVSKADSAKSLRGNGAAAYLDAKQIVQMAKDTGCNAIHPGYGFLSENAAFARLCAQHAITFVGPQPETLALLGDKGQARLFANRCSVPVLAGTDAATSLDEARLFFTNLGADAAIVIKALAGGGGRGMRVVRQQEEIDAAYGRCQSEALAAFGSNDVYVEQLIPRARHIEVQIIGDGSGAVAHLGERECSIQRRHQKLVEVTPSPGLPAALRDRLCAAAVHMAQTANYSSLGTFEFLLDCEPIDGGSNYKFYFIEANPRLQVEHTITEEVTGIDLVQTQLQLAAGRSLQELNLLQPQVPKPRGFAMQMRINSETMSADGDVRPAGGTVSAFEPPSGFGVRTDTGAYANYTINPAFDSLLAKLIVRSNAADFSALLSRSYRALCEFRIAGATTNIGFLQNLVSHPEFIANRIYTRFVDDHIAELLAGAEHQALFVNAEPATSSKSTQYDSASYPAGPAGAEPVTAPMQATVVSILVTQGDQVHAGQQLLILEAMKMEHVVNAGVSGIVAELAITSGATVLQGQPLLFISAADVAVREEAKAEALDLNHIRDDLTEVRQRHAVGLDPARPNAVAKRRNTGQRTARENIANLCDADSFVEYGPLVVAAQRSRRSLEDLIRNTPADGLVGGIGSVNGDLFDQDVARCIAMSYDYTVLAGTQGAKNHAKKDRLFELAERWRLPLVLFAEGGGGRPGDTDVQGAGGLDCMAFYYFAKLSGLVPLVGVVSGRCFAGNAALLGCCDVIIATANANIGMGGPAMVEGGGLGVFTPEEIGPMDVQVPNGVVDIAVENEVEAVRISQQYLAYFQGALSTWECADQRLLRTLIPENRLRIYDVRAVIETLADNGSVLELRKAFGPGMVTALVRVEGRALGVIANNPRHLAGAVDREGADKASRFMQLCDAFAIPLLFLCDTPGIMVGPESEKTALVRHAARMFVTAASLSVPFFTIVLRKSYGLGAMTMAGGSFKAPLFVVAWPTGEFGGMGLEGAVKLGFRKELEAVEEPEKRHQLYQDLVAKAYEQGKATSTAAYFEIDDVIDPADSRRWISHALLSAPPVEKGTVKKRPFVDTW